MSIEHWLPLAEVARRSNIPESTARRYARLFGTFLPFARDGRTVLFDPRCGDVLRRISELFGEGRTAQQVQDVLRRESSIIEVEQDGVTATGHSPILSDGPSGAILPGDSTGSKFTGFLEQMLDQKQELAALRHDVSSLARDLVVERERLAALEAQNQSFRRVLVALLRQHRTGQGQGVGNPIEDLCAKVRTLEEEMCRLSATRSE